MHVSAILVFEPVHYNCFIISAVNVLDLLDAAKDSELGNSRKLT